MPGKAAPAGHNGHIWSREPTKHGAILAGRFQRSLSKNSIKQAGADTTLKNAARDGAEWAWVAKGDTCAFCIMLASNGWQRASKRVLKGNHAEHIHNNCDCEFAVRFDGKSSVGGYDPDRFKAMYDSAEGRTWEEKVNAMRREQYAANKDEINAQKRAAYARRKERYNKGGDPLFKALGEASLSHPAEIEQIVQRAEELGVHIIERSGSIAYSPGLKSGQPGQLYLSKNVSYGAWLHEEQHMIDDAKGGWRGFAGLFDVDRRSQMEYNAYKREVDLALSIGRPDIADELRLQCKDEIERFGGVWDAKKLP